LNGESVLQFLPTQEKERICACFEEIIFLLVGSPHLNPIEPVWKSLKWESSSLIVEGAAEYRALLDAIFTKLTERLSFAGSWIKNHLSGFIQKLR
ncbi:IS630 family transposase, partial [Halobacteriales archaeon QS_4_62_28]